MRTPLDIGAELVERRRAAGLTQRELADALDVTQPQIARWEASRYRSASLANVDAVSRILGIGLKSASSAAAEQSATYAPATPGIRSRALLRLGVSADAIAAFSRSHGIERFELFGSVLNDRFTAASDIDVLVTYAPERTPSLFGANDHEAELAAMFRRDVDLITRPSVEQSDNCIRRREILENALVLYER